ncbi:hypothetical protein [Terrihalobacillus insolitus]|uniref:hypothetical protein n=1 Tax=Terrihalobacillus insolitus TaxID=2950438 RepID=UPI0023402C98|nr:hypothetical protein [Terrihalobacillus insolitus]MDC3413919.1 Mrp/NBP35 family ATP-binding protein [Terrihalobacillus insolitus]
MVVQCDKGCKKFFDVDIQEREHGEGIIESYFQCPHCNSEYTIAVTDEDLRKRQDEVKQLIEKMNKTKNQVEHAKLYETMVKKKEKMIRKMNRLNKKIKK